MSENIRSPRIRSCGKPTAERHSRPKYFRVAMSCVGRETSPCTRTFLATIAMARKEFASVFKIHSCNTICHRSSWKGRVTGHSREGCRSCWSSPMIDSLILGRLEINIVRWSFFSRLVARRISTVSVAGDRKQKEYAGPWG